MDSLPINRILFVRVELPSRTRGIPPKGVLQEVVEHAMQISGVIPTGNLVAVVFDVPRQDINSDTVEHGEEPLDDVDGSESVACRSYLFPFEFRDVCGLENRIDFVRHWACLKGGE